MFLCRFLLRKAISLACSIVVSVLSNGRISSVVVTIIVIVCLYGFVVVVVVVFWVGRVRLEKKSRRRLSKPSDWCTCRDDKLGRPICCSPSESRVCENVTAFLLSGDAELAIFSITGTGTVGLVRNGRS